MTLRFIVLATALPFFSDPARAELQFRQTKLVLPAAVGQEELRGGFDFRNAGTVPVTITNLTTSCGCTTAALERKTYDPGESGTIIATFSAGERSGHQSKTIVVQTNEPKDNVYELTVEADIPPVIVVDPRLLVWNRGVPTDPQVVKVTYAGGKTYRLASAVDASGRFVAEIVTTPGQNAPEIRIKPVRTDEGVLGVMLLDFIAADGARLQRSVLMRVAVIP